MTTTTTVPDGWDELCLISIAREGGSYVNFEALTDDITALDWGEKDVESKAMCGGGHVVRKIPMTMEGITMKMTPIGVGVYGESTGTGIAQFFHPQAADDSSQPVVVSNTLTRNKHKINILWATTLPASANATASSGIYSERIQIFNAYMTGYKPSYDDKQMTVEVTFKWAPFQKDKTRNKVEESTDDSASLAAVTSF